MRLVSLKNGTADGQLAVVSKCGQKYEVAGADFPNLLKAIAVWDKAEPELRHISKKLENGAGRALSTEQLLAPLPRSWQWLDASAFPTHGELMQIAFGLDPIDNKRPLMYQGMSDRFYGPNDDIPFSSNEYGIDFEGEFGVIVDHVPMGTTAKTALNHIRLLVQINDWSLRAIAPIEMKTGFGWVQAKPPCSAAPFAITPDELGSAWSNGRICLDLKIEFNGEQFGKANGELMQFGFHELVAHAALTRDIVAGTIIGSGTVSNPNYNEVGSSCISEVRAIEMIGEGEFSTAFMSFGDTIRMAGTDTDGFEPFGVIKQTVVQA